MKKYEVRANSRNTPHYYERMLVGALLFVFTGLNWILPFVIFGTIDPKSAIYMIVFGLGNLGMAFIVFVDNRSAMVQWIVIICYGVIYLAVSIGIAYTLNYWRLFIIYGYEIVAIFVVIFGFRMLQKNERVQ